MEDKPLRKVIKIAGNQRRLSRIIPVDPRALNHWINLGIKIPVQYALVMETLTDGLVQAEELSPHAKEHIQKFKKYFIRKILEDKIYA